MEKLLNIILLVGLILWFFQGVHSAYMGEMIEPSTFICATLICIIDIIVDLRKINRKGE